MEKKLRAFTGKEIRRTLHNKEWYFAVADVAAALTDRLDDGTCWQKIKQRLWNEGCDVATLCHGLELTAPDGKTREIECTNTEGIFRIIQSIHSPKAESFKRWLAEVGNQQVREIEDPELAADRIKECVPGQGVFRDLDRKTDARHRRPGRANR